MLFTAMPDLWLNFMKKADIILLGYEDLENIGLRSIKAFLDSKNVSSIIMPFTESNQQEILETILKTQPKIVGFSFIFQYTIEKFSDLAAYLRSNGVKSHFTAGGHFPSLEPALTFKEVPELDSIVRFEGEYTLFELFLNLDCPHLWGEIQGLAFRKNPDIIMNPGRSLIEDLDSLPVIYRDEIPMSINGVNMAYMLASRGCLNNCSFCSIRQFYNTSEGRLRRSRSAESVAAEMLSLYNTKQVRIFLFQDDDFANRSVNQKKWIESFLGELDKLNLSRVINWKISCRVDDVEEEMLKTMIDHGLFAIYLGVESGSKTGLETLNKGVTVDQNLEAIALIKKLNIELSIGFMLFDPSSTIHSLRENIHFLDEVGADGYFPINFCKMLPYGGTPVEKQLKAEGRLKGSVLKPDYDFKDPLLNWYSFLVNRIFSRRNFDSKGLVSLLQQADFDIRLSSGFSHSEGKFKAVHSGLMNIIGRANRSAVMTLNQLLDLLILNGVDKVLNDKTALLGLFEKEWQSEVAIEKDLIKFRKKYLADLVGDQLRPADPVYPSKI